MSNLFFSLGIVLGQYPLGAHLEHNNSLHLEHTSVTGWAWWRSQSGDSYIPGCFSYSTIETFLCLVFISFQIKSSWSWKQRCGQPWSSYFITGHVKQEPWHLEQFYVQVFVCSVLSVEKVYLIMNLGHSPQFLYQHVIHITPNLSIPILQTWPCVESSFGVWGSRQTTSNETLHFLVDNSIVKSHNKIYYTKIVSRQTYHNVFNTHSFATVHTICICWFFTGITHGAGDSAYASSGGSSLLCLLKSGRVWSVTSVMVFLMDRTYFIHVYVVIPILHQAYTELTPSLRQA